MFLRCKKDPNKLKIIHFFHCICKLNLYLYINKQTDMKILNNINIDFNAESNRVYELTIVCKSEKEIDHVFNQFENEKNYVVDCFENMEITVISEAWKHLTKKDFVKQVKKIAK